VNIKSRIAPLLLAGIVALGIATVPAVAADAAPSVSTTQAKSKTGTLVVQLVTPAGKVLKTRLEVGYGTQEKQLGGGTTSMKGKITFKKIKAGKSYIAVAFPTASYLIAFKTGVKIAAGKTTTLKLKVALGAAISGKVLDTNGVAVGGVSVNALDSSGNFVGHATTSASGAYKISGLVSGSYTVAFNDDNPAYTTTYWKDAADFDSATFFKVSQQTSKKSRTVTTLVNGTIAAVPVD